ncbi:mevalonate kinase [Fluoribacter dumoffii]|uniref:Mevalonate kinase n=2 Tax=Fluoribacter dumoffii TaxID=463 RepID=A0A377GBD7_9GAMM|nr:mevalonate kinase [Fluoribacter dumoffii NY 23]STO22126.1 mevalonate kinase [Fluoribacter dumoffii]
MMSMLGFKVCIPAKCILSGEFINNQKGYAIISPFERYKLVLKYYPNEIKTIRTITGEGFNSTQIILWSVISRALELLGKECSLLTGYFELNCNIPPCNGLGFFAALYYAVAEWLVYYGLMQRSNLFDFTLKLESSLRASSNGADIAGVMSPSLIMYSYSREIKKLNPTWHPHLYISSTKETTISDDCMQKINEMRLLEPSKAALVDEKMITSSIETRHALESNQKYRLFLLADALNLANECYFEWGLISERVKNHIDILKKYALACKIIEAGYGGYVLSLWKQEPTVDLPFKLYRVNI